MTELKRAWAHRYSLVSLTLVALDFVVSYVFLSPWHLGPALTPTSPQVLRLGWINLVLNGLAVVFSILAIRMEQPKRLAYYALFATLVAIVLCGARFSE